MGSVGLAVVPRQDPRERMYQTMKNHTINHCAPRGGSPPRSLHRVAACLLAAVLAAASVPAVQAASESPAPAAQTLLYDATPETADGPLPTASPLPLPEPSAGTATPETATPLPGNTFLAAAADTGTGVPLDSAHFPDGAFLNSIRMLDTDGDGVLSPAECDGVTSLNVRNQDITSLEGIGCFSHLTYLNCIGNALTSLPLEQLPALTSLLCNENQLTSLDLARVPALKLLHCHDNRLASLDVSPLAQLQELACGDNLFVTLDVSRNKALTYLLYLGGPLQTLTLSGNDALLHLWCSYSLVSRLDLAQAPNLELLGIDRSDLTYLDLGGNEKITSVMASDNLLLAVHTGAGTPAMTLTGQRPVAVQLAAGQTTYDLTNLGVPLSLDCISDVTGARLTGSVLSGLQDGSVVTYRYTDGAANFTATLQFQVSNGWVEPLSLEDWTYGQPANTPHAQAEYGQPQYSYSAAVDGTFTDQVPAQAGTWYVKAVVPPSDGHAGLEAVTEFHILKAQPVCTTPTGLTAVYGSTLASVDPGAGFVWQTPDQKVGNVGTRTFMADYYPDDPVNYASVEGLPIPLQVTPKPAALLWVSPVTGAQDADALTVRDGAETLREGVDYLVSRRQEKGWVILTLAFQGNYTGTVLRGYPLQGEQPEATAVPMATETPPLEPVADPACAAAAAGTQPGEVGAGTASPAEVEGGGQAIPRPAASPRSTVTPVPSAPGTATPEQTLPGGSGEETAPPARELVGWPWLLLLLLLVLAILYLLRDRSEAPPPDEEQDPH